MDFFHWVRKEDSDYNILMILTILICSGSGAAGGKRTYTRTVTKTGPDGKTRTVTETFEDDAVPDDSVRNGSSHFALSVGLSFCLYSRIPH